MLVRGFSEPPNREPTRLPDRHPRQIRVGFTVLQAGAVDEESAAAATRAAGALVCFSASGRSRRGCGGAVALARPGIVALLPRHGCDDDRGDHVGPGPTERGVQHEADEAGFPFIPEGKEVTPRILQQLTDPSVPTPTAK
ncbi:hypothetical protein ACFUIW_24375 [Streptomyces sp. NPDC057245]|uniref:hypothetical protein n=1 Tax=Streptomyces TaxID=1883 RepID=UPI001C1E0475|nr:hypothetical protein [Streptomyces sp. A108]